MNHLNTPPQHRSLNRQPGLTFKNFLKWFFGIVFLLMAITILISDQALFSFICWSLAGVVSVPPILMALENGFKCRIPRPLKYLSVIALYILGIVGAFGSKGFDVKPSKNSTIIKKEEKSSINSFTDDATTDSVSPGTKSNAFVNTVETDVERKERLEKQFSPWDGSHIKLVSYVKDNMNDPDSFEHIETTYFDKGTYLVVVMKYRGKNDFGAKVVNHIKAKIDLDGEVLEVISISN